MGAHYAGLWILFTVLFALAMGAYYFSKWHIKGPTIKARFKRIWKTITFTNEKKAASVKRGKVVVSDSFESEIMAAREAAQTGQEMLQAEVKVDHLERAKREAQAEIEKKAAEKAAKANNKNKKKKKGKAKVEEVEDITKVSIFDQLENSRLTAQDLLHQAELEKEVDNDIADVRTSLYDAGETIEEVVEEVVVTEQPLTQENVEEAKIYSGEKTEAKNETETEKKRKESIFDIE